MSLIKHSSILIVGVIISNGLAYVFHFIAGRYLGPEDYGAFGALMALFLLIAMPSSAISFAITKYTAKFVSENSLGKITILRRKIQNDVFIIAAIVFLFIILFSKPIAGYLKITSIVPLIIIGITLIFTILLPVNRGILQGMKKFKTLSWNNVIEAFARLALLVLFLFLGFGVNGTIMAYGLAYFVAFLWVFPFIKEIKPKNTINEIIETKPIYTFIFQVLFVNIILQSLINIPSLFIKHYYSSEFTGYWTAALNIARLSLFVSAAIGQVMFPEIAGENNLNIQKKIFKKAALYVLLVSSAMALLFFIIPDFCIKILYGPAYSEAIPILKWLGIAMIFLGLLQLWTNYLLAKLN